MFHSCHVVHEVPQRVRFRIPELSSDQTLIEELEYYLSQQEGVEGVRINLYCCSIIIHFSKDRWNPHSLEHLIRNLSCDQLISFSASNSSGRVISEGDDHSVFKLALSSLAVIIGWLPGPVIKLLVLLILLGSSRTIFERAFHSLTRYNKLNVDVLDAFATLVLALQGRPSTAAFMVWLVNLGDYIRSSTMEYSKRTIDRLLEFKNRYAWIVTGEEKKRIPVEDVRVGDRVVVYTGEMIPFDGAIDSGVAMVDQQALTGESMPVEKSFDDKVFAGTVVREGKIYLRVEGVGDETEVAKIVHLVKNAPTRDTRIQNYAEEWADRLVPYSFLGAGASIAMTGNTSRAASLLIIDYGTGIRVVAPTSVLASMTKAARSGILIKGGRYIEKLAEVDAIILDKTGTLTVGTPKVTRIIPYRNGQVRNERDLMTFVAAAEQRLNHPVADAIVETAQSMNISIPPRSTSEYKIGYGIEAGVNDSIIHVGSKRYFKEKEIPLPDNISRDIEHIEDKAVSPILAAKDFEVIGLLGLEDQIRPDAFEMIPRLKALGIKEIVMLTGDRAHVAKEVADSLKIDRYFSEVFPDEKLTYVKRLQEEGYTVAVVGDGINDSPALAQADAGIAVDGGTDIARETAHIVLHDNKLENIPKSIEISRACIALIRQNWNIISIPNSIAIGLTLAGLIGPVGATVISNGSAVAAGFNALRPLMK